MCTGRNSQFSIRCELKGVSKQWKIVNDFPGKMYRRFPPLRLNFNFNKR